MAEMHPFDEWTEPQLQAYMQKIGELIDEFTPPNTGFVLLLTPFGPGQVAQYICNCRRDTAIAWMRETADRLEKADTIERQPFEGTDDKPE